MTLQTDGSISFSQIAAEFGDTAPYSMSEFYKGGAKVPSTISTTATQAPPSSNGTYSDFGDVSGLTLVRSTGTSYSTSGLINTTVGSGSSTTATFGSSNRDQLVANTLNNISDNSNNVTVTITGSGGSRTYSTTSSQTALYATGSGTWTIAKTAGSRNDSVRLRWYSRVATTTTNYAFTNNVGTDVTVETTTIADGATTNINASGDYDISFSETVNANVPTDGAIDFTNFYGGRSS